MTDIILFELLMLAAFSVSITCFENAVSQISECMNPTIGDQSMSVHVNLSEGEFDLLQIEGQCYLFCVTHDEYSAKVRNRNYVHG